MTTAWKRNEKLILSTSHILVSVQLDVKNPANARLAQAQDSPKSPTHLYATAGIYLDGLLKFWDKGNCHELRDVSPPIALNALQIWVVINSLPTAAPRENKTRRLTTPSDPAVPKDGVFFRACFSCRILISAGSRGLGLCRLYWTNTRSSPTDLSSDYCLVTSPSSRLQMSSKLDSNHCLVLRKQWAGAPFCTKGNCRIPNICNFNRDNNFVVWAVRKPSRKVSRSYR